MIDLACLVADKNMEAAVSAMLRRPESLGIRQIHYKVLRHENRDPGCFHHPHVLLRGYHDRARHALVMLDADWQGAPASTGEELEGLLEENLSSSSRESSRHAKNLGRGRKPLFGRGLRRLVGCGRRAALRRGGLGDWARPIVIEPELEVWVFSASPHVPDILGWETSATSFRDALEARSLWEAGRPKPSDPKRALEWILRRTKRPRSSAIYGELATRISLARCDDRSFLRLRGLLREWFPP